MAPGVEAAMIAAAAVLPLACALLVEVALGVGVAGVELAAAGPLVAARDRGRCSGRRERARGCS
jgi:hypothetical protein